jgi:hypothetical protein
MGQDGGLQKVKKLSHLLIITNYNKTILLSKSSSLLTEWPGQPSLHDGGGFLHKSHKCSLSAESVRIGLWKYKRFVTINSTLLNMYLERSKKQRGHI